MRVYKYPIAGGNPFPGIITVVAARQCTATKLVDAEIEKMNASGHQGPFRRNGEPISKSLVAPMIVYVESGEQ